MTRYGATPEEWTALSLVAGLTSDLLPVVSDTTTTIGEHSKLKQLGKTPSRFNSRGHVGGILDWSTKQSTAEEVSQWSRESRYGICVITRRIRAIDVDITDETLAGEIRHFLNDLAIRRRGKSTKFLAAFELPGNYSKRTIKTAHGVIEFLATGQQFVAAGQHPSGERYWWEGGTPTDFHLMNEAEFSSIWNTLQQRYGIEPSTESKLSNKQEKLNEASANDPTAQFLYSHGLVLSQERDGRLHLVCPFADQHTTESSESATSYFPANTGGYTHGTFSCRHAHCSTRTQAEFIAALGIAADDFEDTSGIPGHTPDGGRIAAPTPSAATTKRNYIFEPAHVFAQGASGAWIIKGILPQADLVVVFGESGSGKSFFTLDLVAHIAQGLLYRGKKVAQGDVAYIAAEGSAGFRNRLKAHAQHHELDLAQLPLTVLAASPNFMRRDNVEAVRDAILALPTRPTIIVVDTLAQVTPGSNENSGEDMGRALGHCKMLRAATGAMILLIHHSGKDASKGARGHSSLEAAADAEIEIVRDSHSPQRVATLTKLRDGGDNLEMGFKLDVVNLGVDADGDPITSCVVVPTDAPAHAARQPVGDLESLVLRVLDDLQGVTGEDVKIDDLLAAVVSQRVPPAGRDNRRLMAQRALDSLVVKSRLSLENGLVTAQVRS